MEKTCQLLDLGSQYYQPTWNLQQKLVEKRIKEEIPDTLILVEHEAVFTIGRAGRENNILVSQDLLEQEGIKVHRVERGGDITYHGPGQLVGYPIINLNYHRRDLHWVLHAYEEVIVKLLWQEFGIKAGRNADYTGVWIGDEKIAAIGVAVSKWVTYHGFALNISPNLRHFSLINPCGITDKGVTSLHRVLGTPVAFDAIKVPLLEHFRRVFGYSGYVYPDSNGQ